MRRDASRHEFDQFGDALLAGVFERHELREASRLREVVEPLLHVRVGNVHADQHRDQRLHRLALDALGEGVPHVARVVRRGVVVAVRQHEHDAVAEEVVLRQVRRIVHRGFDGVVGRVEESGAAAVHVATGVVVHVAGFEELEPVNFTQFRAERHEPQHEIVGPRRVTTRFDDFLDRRFEQGTEGAGGAAFVLHEGDHRVFGRREGVDSGGRVAIVAHGQLDLFEVVVEFRHIANCFLSAKIVLAKPWN